MAENYKKENGVAMLTNRDNDRTLSHWIEYFVYYYRKEEQVSMVSPVEELCGILHRVVKGMSEDHHFRLFPVMFGIDIYRFESFSDYCISKKVPLDLYLLLIELNCRVIEFIGLCGANIPTYYDIIERWENIINEYGLEDLFEKKIKKESLHIDSSLTNACKVIDQYKALFNEID